MGGDHVDVVGVVHRAQGDAFIAVEVAVELAVADDEGTDGLAGVDGLPRAVDDPAPEEWQERLGKHLGVHAKVAVAREGVEHRGGDGADPHLERGAIFDEAGYVATDGRRFRAWGFVLGLRQWFIDLDGEVDVIQTEAMPRGARHLAVDLGDHGLRMACSGEGTINRDTERAASMLVRGRDLDEGDIERKRPAWREERWYFAEEDGGVVGPAFLDGPADVRADEEGVVAITPFHLRRHVRSGAIRMHMDDFHAPEVVAQHNHPIDEHVWRCRAAMDV